MVEKTNAKEQELKDSPAQKENVMQDIEDMITNMLMNAIGEKQAAETSEQFGLGQDASGEGGANALPAEMSLADIKKLVGTMQKFLDSLNHMIAQAEGGTDQYTKDDDKFLEDYFSTADNILEIAAFSAKDPLTGLSNRYGFDNRLVLEWNRAIREKTPLTLLIFGVSGLTDNDNSYEPLQKDIIIQTISSKLERSIKRATDFVARWSDSEFAALLPITNMEGATIVTERIVKEIGSIDDPKHKGGKLAACIGVSIQAADQHHEKPAAFEDRVHKALEKARESKGSKIIFD